MTPQQISLIQTSWASVVPIQDTAAGLFYQRLFVLDPSVRPMFKGDMQERGRKLMKMLGTVVNSLTRLDELVPVAQDMARRHVGYGVQPAHYDTAGAALLWTSSRGWDRRLPMTRGMPGQLLWNATTGDEGCRLRAVLSARGQG